MACQRITAPFHSDKCVFFPRKFRVPSTKYIGIGTSAACYEGNQSVSPGVIWSLAGSWVSECRSDQYGLHTCWFPSGTPLIRGSLQRTSKVTFQQTTAQVHDVFRSRGVCNRGCRVLPSPGIYSTWSRRVEGMVLDCIISMHVQYGSAGHRS